MCAALGRARPGVAHTRTHAPTHPHTHIYMYTHTHSHAHTHTRTYTHTQCVRHWAERDRAWVRIWRLYLKVHVQVCCWQLDLKGNALVSMSTPVVPQDAAQSAP